MKYLVIDIKTQLVISEHSKRTLATRKCDRLDAIYGAVRYIVRSVIIEA